MAKTPTRSFNMRIDEDTWDKFTAACDEAGLSGNAAAKLWVQKVAAGEITIRVEMTERRGVPVRDGRGDGGEPEEFETRRSPAGGDV